MAVEMFRIDERMLHGQVMTTFSKVLNIDEYIVVNTEVSKDEQQRALLELALPPGADFDVVSPETFAKIDKENDYWGEHTFVVFRYLEDCLAAIKAGAVVKKLTVGGMYSRGREGEVKEEIALFVADSDRALFRELESLGVELEYRVSFYNNPVPLKNVVKY